MIVPDIIIAVDGFSGTGKSTLAKLIAEVPCPLLRRMQHSYRLRRLILRAAILPRIPFMVAILSVLSATATIPKVVRQS